MINKRCEEKEEGKGGQRAEGEKAGMKLQQSEVESVVNDVFLQGTCYGISELAHGAAAKRHWASLTLDRAE